MSSFSAGEDEPSTAEWAVLALSVAVTLLLFGTVAWHAAVTPPNATPEATVTDVQELDDGRVAVTVEVRYEAGTGLESVTAAVDCADESITFTHVPAATSRSGRLVCPADTSSPSAAVVRWVEA